MCPCLHLELGINSLLSPSRQSITSGSITFPIYPTLGLTSFAPGILVSLIFLNHNLSFIFLALRLSRASVADTCSSIRSQVIWHLLSGGEAWGKRGFPHCFTLNSSIIPLKFHKPINLFQHSLKFELSCLFITSLYSLNDELPGVSLLMVLFATLSLMSYLKNNVEWNKKLSRVNINNTCFLLYYFRRIHNMMNTTISLFSLT